MKKNLLVYGAGAIGRGYIPWVFSPAEFNYSFVERNPDLRGLLNQSGRFTTYKTVGDGYESLNVPVLRCYAPGEELQEVHRAGAVDAIVTAVGPRNVLSLKEGLTGLKIPVICCENDSSLSSLMASATGNANFVFAIPDVITSCTASNELLAKDPLSIITEDGVCFIDDRVSNLGGNCKYVSAAELHKQWLAKLYIHNTPHCIAAYLGASLGVTYLHQSMQYSTAEEIVTGAMHEMEQMLIKKHGLESSFVKWYGGKELQRFRNTLLHDPICRVAREPFRKLSLNERLIGAAGLALGCGIMPTNIILGIMAAFVYENDSDPDFNIALLRRSLSPADFLKIIIRLRPEEALYELMLTNWEKNLRQLGNLDK